MSWAFVWMMVVLKIPIVALLWLVWWSAKEPETEDQSHDEGGGSRRHPHSPRPRDPRPPRRGPHAEPPPRSPKRVRARARRLETERRL